MIQGCNYKKGFYFDTADDQSSGDMGAQPQPLTKLSYFLTGVECTHQWLSNLKSNTLRESNVKSLIWHNKTGLIIGIGLPWNLLIRTLDNDQDTWIIRTLWTNPRSPKHQGTFKLKYHIYLVKRHSIYYLSVKIGAATIWNWPPLDVGKPSWSSWF